MSDDFNPTPLPIPDDQPASETAWWILLALLGMLADKLRIPPKYL